MKTFDQWLEDMPSEITDEAAGLLIGLVCSENQTIFLDHEPSQEAIDLLNSVSVRITNCQVEKLNRFMRWWSGKSFRVTSESN